MANVLLQRSNVSLVFSDSLLYFQFSKWHDRSFDGLKTQHLKILFIYLSTKDNLVSELLCSCPSATDLHVNGFTMFIAKWKKVVICAQGLSDSSDTLSHSDVWTSRSRDKLSVCLLFCSFSPLRSVGSPPLHLTPFSSSVILGFQGLYLFLFLWIIFFGFHFLAMSLH